MHAGVHAVPGSTGTRIYGHYWLYMVPESLKPLNIYNMKRDRHILQKYLDKELSESDFNRFERELKASPELMGDLELYKEVDEALSDTEVLDFRAQLTDLREETRRIDSGRRIFRFTKPWHYAASAALALLVAIGLATVLGKPLTNSELFAKYMKPYELVLTNRSVDNSGIQYLMNQGQEYYLIGNYARAVGYFDEILELNDEMFEAEFYKGASNFENDQFVDASKSFTRVIEHNDNLFVQKAEWYLAGCLLAMDETDRARRQLALIASSANHFYKDDAAKILKRMKR